MDLVREALTFLLAQEKKRVHPGTGTRSGSLLETAPIAKAPEAVALSQFASPGSTAGQRLKIALSESAPSGLRPTRCAQTGASALPAGADPCPLKICAR